MTYAYLSAFVPSLLLAVGSGVNSTKVANIFTKGEANSSQLSRLL